MPTPRLFRLASLALLASFVLTACGPSTSTSTPAPPSTPGLLTGTPADTSTPTATPTPAPQIGVAPDALRGIHIQVWHAFTGAAADVFTNQLALFNTLNQWGIVVYQTAYGDYSSLFEDVDSALPSDRHPDLVIALPEQSLAWEAKGVVVDLNPYLYDPVWGLTANEIADIPATFWTQDQVNGLQLGAPAQRSARFLFYNQTWARELGFSSPPASAEEFRQQACAANASFRADAVEQNDGYGGWIVDADWMTVYPWLLAFGGGVTDGGGYRFRTDQNLAALEFLKTLKEDACAWITADPENPFAMNPGPFYEQFSHRSALFITGDLTEAAALSATLTRLGSTDEWTMIPFPGPETQAVTVYGPSYTLLESTPERQLASWLFVRWLLSAENQAKWVETTGTLPLRTATLDLLADYRSAHPQWDTAVQSLPLAQGVPQRADWHTVRYVLADGTLSIFRMDVKIADIPNVLAEMDATAEELSGK